MKHSGLLLILILLQLFPGIGVRVLAQKGVNGLKQGQSYFLENSGQIKDQNGNPNRAVKFLLPLAGGLNLQLRANGFSYDTYKKDDSSAGAVLNPGSGRRSISGSDKRTGNAQSAAKTRFHRIDILFLGANSSPQLLASDCRPLHYNYSQITAAGTRNIIVRAFGRVTYKNIYPAIDLVFENNGKAGNQAGAEYYFVIRPGGNPSSIRWAYKGALQTAIRQEHIEIGVNRGKILEYIPRSYLDDKAILSKAGSLPAGNIHISYKRLAPDTYCFIVPAYDRARTLIIDPTPDLIWGTYYGGEMTDEGYCIARDGDGNIVFGGLTDSYTIVATAGAYQTVMAGFADAMIGKFTSDGALLWATYYGGTYEDVANGIAIDQNNNIVVVGATFSQDGIATPGAFKTTTDNPFLQTNGFIARFGADGQLLWGTYYGGEYEQVCYGVAIDLNDDIVVVGGTASSNEMATPGAYQSAYADGPAGQLLGYHDVFLAKFDLNGSRIWGTYYGGVGDDRAFGVAVDPDNNIVLTGGSMSTHAMSTVGSFQPAIGIGDVTCPFIAKFSTAGSLIWGTYYGSGGLPNASGVGLCVATDKKGNIYAAGTTAAFSNISTPGLCRQR